MASSFVCIIEAKQEGSISKLCSVKNCNLLNCLRTHIKVEIKLNF